jgi:DNA-nicking Smr family endonuclease
MACFAFAGCIRYTGLSYLVRERREDGTPWTRLEQVRDRTAMAKLKLDMHDIYNKGGRIEDELNRIIREAVEKRIKLVEIIPGKGSGQLKKKVLRFLDRKEIKQLYHRVEKDSKNFGRLFVHFRF